MGSSELVPSSGDSSFSDGEGTRYPTEVVRPHVSQEQCHLVTEEDSLLQGPGNAEGKAGPN